jgi:hypothetical protein
MFLGESSCPATMIASNPKRPASKTSRTGTGGAAT